MSFTQQVITAARRAARWHVTSQEVARRNAMLASTALTQRRVERIEVEDFLATYHARRVTRPERRALAEHTG